MSPYAAPDVERLIGTLRHRPVDRVPNYEALICERATRYILGRDDLPHSWALAPADQVELVRRIGQDVVSVPLIEWGLAVEDDEGGRAYEGNIRDRDTLRRAVLWDHERHIVPAIERIKAYVEATEGTRVGLLGCISSLIFDRTVYALGFENFMMSIHTDPGFVEEVLEIYTEYAVAMMRAACQFPIDVFHAGDDVAYQTGLFIAPPLFRRIWLERMRRVVTIAHEHDIPFMYHSDGGLRDVLPLLVELGVAGVNPIEPYSNDIAAIQTQYGDHLTLIGNMDITTLAFKTADEVREATRELLRQLKPRRGWVAASSHSITDIIEPENFLTMLRTVQEEGRYN